MNWLDTLKKLAPTVASAIGGPLEGVAVTAIGELLGISEPSQDKIKVAIENATLTGEQISGLRQLELKLKAEEEERGFRYAELEFKNVDSARERDKEIVKTTGHNYRADTMYVLAVLVICGLVFLIWKDQDVNEYLKGIITLVLGRFLGYLDNIYNFEFGTTRVNRAKDETINQLVNK